MYCSAVIIMFDHGPKTSTWPKLNLPRRKFRSLVTVQIEIDRQTTTALLLLYESSTIVGLYYRTVLYIPPAVLTVLVLLSVAARYRSLRRMHIAYVGFKIANAFVYMVPLFCLYVQTRRFFTHTVTTAVQQYRQTVVCCSVLSTMKNGLPRKKKKAE